MASPQVSPSPPGPTTSIGDQVSLLQQRGMSIPDPTEAERFLSNVNYYRLRGYLEPFVDQTKKDPLRPFQAGTTLDIVVERYFFDTRLRALLIEAFNYIEISLRTQWTYHLSHTHGGGEYAHLNPKFFSQIHSDNLATLQEDYDKRGKYVHPYDFNSCPIWAISEVMSFGQLSRWYGSTISPVRRLVADHYELHQRMLRSLLPHLAPVRNLCAHHERLWDRVFATKFSLPSRMGTFPSPETFFNETDTGKLYNTLVMIAYLTIVITGNTDWPRNLVALMNQYPNVPQSRMGFIENWQTLEIWQERTEEVGI